MELPEIEEFMRIIAQALDEQLQKAFNRKMGFFLSIFDFGDPPRVGHYITNTDRSDMIQSLKDTIEIMEKKQDIPAAHPTKQ